MKNTSLEVYYRMVASKELSKSRFDLIKEMINYGKPVTRAELSQLTMMSDGKFYPINSVCGRVKEMLDMGLIIEHGIKKCSITGNNAHLLKVVEK